MVNGIRGAERAVSPAAEFESNALQVAETPFEKGVVLSLMAIDALSYVSPFRWIPELTGCGPDNANFSQDASFNNTEEPGVHCVEDPECFTPKVCEGGFCVFPKPKRDGGSAESTPQTSAPPAPIEECKPGDVKPCGPCEVGIQTCNEEHLWQSACDYTPEQLERSCYTGRAETKNLGECHAGTQSCRTGSWGSCEGEVTPQAEICDNKDNNCDGQIDEGENNSTFTRAFYPGDPETLGKGICLSGMQYCEEGNWVASAEPILPQPETCDGKDNNCDGQTDEEGCGRLIGEPCYDNYSHRPYNDCYGGKCISPHYYEGGYCTEEITITMAWHNECRPAHDYRKAVCVSHSQLGILMDGPFCVATCDTDADCRTEEHYQCKSINGSSYKACLPEHEEVTIGNGICAE